MPDNKDERNPYLGSALESVVGGVSGGASAGQGVSASGATAGPSPSNVSDSLTFLLTRALNATDPAACYATDLIRAAAAAPGTQARDASRRLKAKYGKDLNLIQWNADVRDARAQLATAGPTILLTNETGTIKSILANAILELQRSPLKLAYDTFSSKVMIQTPALWAKDGPWSDIDDVSAANYLQHQSVTVSSAVANEAALYLAHQHPYHPLRDWLAGLSWDGVPRVDTWMVDYLGVHDDLYHRGVAAKWMISAVARIMRPGCKADHMIVLEGPEGKRKSSALRALTNGHMDSDLGVQWFRDTMPPIDKDDIGLYMQGVWIIEIGELDAIRGKEWTRVKAFLSAQRDTFRRKFGRNMQDYPRQCIFAASTNEEHWAGDPTGARRFWPVRVDKVNVNGILKWREQLWAEARSRYDEEEKWWLSEDVEALAKEEQAERAPDDAWQDRVSRAIDLMVQVDEFSISEVMDKMGIPVDKSNPFIESKISRALAALGWERHRRRDGRGRGRRYRKPE